MNNRPIYKLGAFAQSGTYQNAKLRTYATHYDSGLAQSYMAATDGGRNITDATVGSVVGSMVSPQTAASADIQIDNGWQNERLSFSIQFMVPNAFTNEPDIVALTGYTSHFGVSSNHSFDPKMRLYFNSAIVVSSIRKQQPNGQIYYQRVVQDASHIFSSRMPTHYLPLHQNQQQIGYDENALYYATPKNVINTMLVKSEGLDRFGRGLMDYRAKTTAGTVKLSSYDNASPARYASNILFNLSSNLMQVDTGIAFDERRAYLNTATAVKDPDMLANVVLAYIITNSEYNMTGYVEWETMCRIFPEINDANTPYTRRHNMVTAQNLPDAQAGNFANWNAVNYETLIATAISQTVPSLMATSLLGQINFYYSNNVSGRNENKFTIFSAKSLVDGLDASLLTNRFVARFNAEIAPIITNQFRSYVDIHVSTSLSTDVNMMISYCGGAPTPYCVPAFCDALYTPIVATNPTALVNIANDVETYAQSVFTVNYQQ